MPDEIRSVAITGASGFVGRYLVSWLGAKGFHCRAILRCEAGAAGLAESETVVLGEGADDQAWRQALAGTQAVVHLAGRAHVMQEASADPAAAYHTANVELTRQALAAAAESGCRVFVFASSVKAIGESSERPWTEETVPRPEDDYGRTKLGAEQLVRTLGPRLGMHAVVLRLPLIYGPGMRANMLRLFAMVERGVPLPFASVSNRRSLLFVGNAAAAIECCLRGRGTGSETYHVSDGEDLSTPDLVQRIATALGRRARLFPVPTRLLIAAARVTTLLPVWTGMPGFGGALQRLVTSLQVDSTRIRTALGFDPPYSVAAGLAETAAWYRARSVADTDHQSRKEVA
jgi:nucleoside-diphosphate-sugar epimerase